ncbi:DUF2332 domain-containing protein [Streptosporangium sp. 'caverna']|uniref:DUF2332 domain-containing protein n=1 Tax=Streptosporangium sp. 'caverna' TaxID=2202249 RepID=UPI000D7D40EA|nr:DUF2332 domain-containing protein [Streptosporangium sp. 'caverna']AWS39947.1 DUF2332 domain-containing protein [Streptosporangium sp. 'caverna']
MDTAELYLRFAVREVREHSPAYENLARGIAADARLLALIDDLPPIKRQPNLLLASVRFLGGPVADFAPFRSWVVRHWAEVRDTILTRRTQTNEVGRCASLLPVLAGLAQPLALIEVGASAGLCLYPDRYRYHYDDLPAVGPEDSPVVLACRTNGKVPVPGRVPEVVWRAGLDLNPLDVRDEEEMRWLECLVWPGQDERLLRLRGAVRVAREDPPHLVRGDLNETLRDLVALAPKEATVVVFHSAVLPYLEPEARDRFVSAVRSLPVRWISNEGSPRLPSMLARLEHGLPEDRLAFLPALDGEPVAMAGPHGEWLNWLDA